MARGTVYRFLNAAHTKWRRFLLLFSSRVINRELEPLTTVPTGAIRCRKSIWKAKERLVERVEQAGKSGVRTSHLLFDRWFAFSATVRVLLANPQPSRPGMSMQ